MDQKFDIAGGVNPDTELNSTFPTMEEMERWFERKYCGIARPAVVPNSPVLCAPHRVEEALLPYSVARSEWLRQPNNEEWYAVRVALVHAVWDELKKRHESILREALREARNGRREIQAHLDARTNQLKECMEQRNAIHESNNGLVAVKEVLKLLNDQSVGE